VALPAYLADKPRPVASRRGIGVVIDDVSRTYPASAGPAAGVFGICAELTAGSFVTVSGPSGSGKSTLLNLVAALDHPTSGRLVVDGRDIAAAPERERAEYRLRLVGCLFQDAPLIGELSVANNVVLPGLLARSDRREARDRAQELLDRVGLSMQSAMFPAQLSVGQRQRAALARALMNRPRLLLADEPTGNLDRATGRQVMELVAGAQAEGCTVVVVTHDPEIAAAGDQHLRLLDGRLVA
jgi:putative ABC transport system ATP-binding protein